MPRIQKTTARVAKPRISRSKGKASKRTTFVRDIVKEVAGYVVLSLSLSLPLRATRGDPGLTLCPPHSLAPYERRVIELLRNSKDKRARKLAKKRLGTFGRAKAKVEEMQKVITESRRTH